MTTAEATAERIALPRYNLTPDWNTPVQIDDATAEKVAARIIELGASHGFHTVGRAPTQEEQLAYKEDRLDNAPPKLEGRYSSLRYIYTRGPVEQALEEVGADPNVRANRHAVEKFLEPIRVAKEAQRRADAEAKHNAALEAFLDEYQSSPAVERYIRANCGFGQRGTAWSEFTITDKTDWFKRAVAKTHDQWHKPLPAYAPKESGLKLRADKAFYISRTQEAYADYSTCLIPLEVKQPVDVEAAQANLNALLRRLDTHTGLAGSGSSWSGSIVVEEDGAYALISGRHSIAD